MTTIDDPQTESDGRLDPEIDRALSSLEANLAMLSDAGFGLDGRDEPDDYAWDFHRAAVLSAHDTLRDRLGHPTTPEIVDREYWDWDAGRRGQRMTLRAALTGGRHP